MDIATQKDIVKEKVKFYFSEKIKAHVKMIPNGSRDGTFESGLIKDEFYWFLNSRTGIPQRLFLYEIYDIEDFTEGGKK